MSRRVNHRAYPKALQGVAVTRPQLEALYRLLEVNIDLKGCYRRPLIDVLAEAYLLGVNTTMDHIRANPGIMAEDAGAKLPPTTAHDAMRAVRTALPILDDDLASYQGDTPPRLWDARGFVCLDDVSCDRDRWKDCEATLKALAAIRAVLPPAEWEADTYATTQSAVEHFCRAAGAAL